MSAGLWKRNGMAIDVPTAGSEDRGASAAWLTVATTHPAVFSLVKNGDVAAPWNIRASWVLGAPCQRRRGTLILPLAPLLVQRHEKRCTVMTCRHRLDPVVGPGPEAVGHPAHLFRIVANDTFSPGPSQCNASTVVKR